VRIADSASARLGRSDKALAAGTGSFEAICLPFSEKFYLPLCSAAPRLMPTV
jgi:hypothetical protein